MGHVQLRSREGLEKVSHAEGGLQNVLRYQFVHSRL